MNSSAQSRGGVRHPVSSGQPSRRPAIVASLISLAVVGIVINHYLLTDTDRNTEGTSQGAEDRGRNTEVGAQRRGASVLGQRPAVRGPSLVVRRVAPTALPPMAVADSAGARQVIGQMAQVQVEGGKLTAEQAQQLKQGLQQLAAQGPAAVPAIREFLEQNQDLNFGAEGSKSVGVPSLRAGLLAALGQIGGPEAVQVSYQVLKTTGDPLEVALSARNVEEGAPGQYHQETLDAARQALAQAGQTNSPGADVGPLFQALQAYGGSEVAADLEKLATNWNYYATMALAGLPSGQGIPSLLKLAQDSASGQGIQYEYKLALQMLAQLSPQYPDAASALLGMVQQGQVPDKAWPQIAEGLGGNQYQFTRQLPQNAIPPGASVVTGASDTSGQSQTFYSTPLSTDPAVAGELNQRLALVDQLLASTTNPGAVAALQRARANLTAKPGG